MSIDWSELPCFVAVVVAADQPTSVAPNLANGTTGWELALVTAPSSNESATASSTLVLDLFLSPAILPQESLCFLSLPLNGKSIFLRLSQLSLKYDQSCFQSSLSLSPSHTLAHTNTLRRRGHTHTSKHCFAVSETVITVLLMNDAFLLADHYD